MKIIQNFRVGLRDIGITNNLTNYGILSYFEDIGTIHSDSAGYGIKDIPTKHRTWILMDWKLDVISRPKFGENIKVKTWSSNIDKPTFHVYRNYEIFDEKENLIATGISKWVFFDTENMKIAKIDNSLIALFNPEGNEQDAESQIEKIKEPASFENMVEYVVNRGDIDINQHVHNLNYLKLAYEALPEDIYLKKECNHVRIMYKRQIKLGDKIKCLYSSEDNIHTVVIKSDDEKTLHAIVKLF